MPDVNPIAQDVKNQINQLIPADYAGYRFFHFKQMALEWLHLERFTQCDRWFEKYCQKKRYGSKDREIYRDLFFLFLRFGWGAHHILCQVTQKPLKAPIPSDHNHLKKVLEETFLFLEEHPEEEITWVGSLFYFQNQLLQLKKGHVIPLPLSHWWFNFSQNWWEEIKRLAKLHNQSELSWQLGLKPPLWAWSPYPQKRIPNLPTDQHCAYAFDHEAFQTLPNRSEFWIQDINSQICCHQTPLNNKDWLWDMCAGAGGKTINLAKRPSFQGTILATDIRKRVLEIIPKRLSQNPSLRSKIYQKVWDATEELSFFEEQFEKQKGFQTILIDAPCSGIGRFRRSPGLLFWNFEKLKETYRDKQMKLLENAYHYLLPAGHLVYITCSWLTSENENHIENLLQNQPTLQLLQHNIHSYWEQDGDTLSFFHLQKRQND